MRASVCVCVCVCVRACVCVHECYFLCEILPPGFFLFPKVHNLLHADGFLLSLLLLVFADFQTLLSGGSGEKERAEEVEKREAWGEKEQRERNEYTCRYIVSLLQQLNVRNSVYSTAWHWLAE